MHNMSIYIMFCPYKAMKMSYLQSFLMVFLRIYKNHWLTSALQDYLMAKSEFEEIKK